jgi:hypothetical protein
METECKVCTRFAKLGCWKSFKWTITITEAALMAFSSQVEMKTHSLLSDQCCTIFLDGVAKMCPEVGEK